MPFRGRRDRLGRAGRRAHAAAPSSAGASPAIISPSTSRGVSPGTMPTIAAAIHDHDPVGEGGHLVELGRDDHHGHAGVAGLDDPLVDELDRADIDAAGRLRRDEQRQVAAELARQHDLLLVAARERAHRGADARAAHVELAELLLREFVQRPPLQIPGLDERLAARAVEHEVLGDRERPDETVFVAVLGDEADALVEDPPHAPADELLAVERCGAAHLGLEAEQRFGQLRLPVALDTGDGEDLAAAHIEADLVDDDAGRSGR